MRQRSLINIGIVSIGNVGNAFLGLLFITAIARSLNLSEFGKYILLTSVLVAISKLIDFGSNSIYVAKSLIDETFDKNIFLTLKLILTVFSIPIGIFILSMLHILDIKTLGIFILGLMFYGTNVTLFAIFQKKEKFVHAVGLNTFPALIKGCIAILVLIGTYMPTLESAFSIFSLSMGSCLLFYFLLPKEVKNTKVKLKFKEAFILLKLSSPAGIEITINNGWSALSNAAANILTNISNVGIFSVADKFANIFALLSLSIFTVLLPKNAKKKNTIDQYEIAFLSIVLIIFATIISFVPDIGFTKIFGDTFFASGNIFRILIFASAITAIHTFMDNYFFIYEKTKYLMYISLSKVSVFILSVYFFISTFGLIGIAYAQLLSAIIALVLTISFLKKLEYKN